MCARLYVSSKRKAKESKQRKTKALPTSKRRFCIFMQKKKKETKKKRKKRQKEQTTSEGASPPHRVQWSAGGGDKNYLSYIETIGFTAL